MTTPTKLNEYSYLVEKEGKMNVPLKIFASEKLMEKMLGDKCIQQGINVACMPGIQGWSIMMPDAHQGYGFSIGGVAAFDARHGCISPGGIGFDINCGVRLVATSLTRDQVLPKIQELLDGLFKAIPCGVGMEAKERLTDEELDAILLGGARYLVEEKQFGEQQDIDNCEEGGCLAAAKPEFVSRRARARGRRQLGTLGAGNHFIEIQTVQEIYDQDTAKAFGLTNPDQVVFMIHCGSRGLGHQVASDFLRQMEEEYPDLVEQLPEKDLVYAPLGSKIADEYFGAMCAAANFAWANRHSIANNAKKVFSELFPEVSFHAVYDVCHNIAKKEIHTINGEEKEVMVHRKGATRAFGPGSDDLPEAYKGIGQPVLIPGSMGTGSYVLVGTDQAMQQSFGSTAHGAGRVMSRHKAKQLFDGEALKKELEDEEIYLKAGSVKGVADEAPLAYKDVDEVIKVSHDAHIGEKVARLKPLGVIKG
ncbi:MAG: RtcB family protein [Nanoarchaeota archaeon]|nr:RtcB family protein [Nanoarchaeota archaeon]